jgi:hypothetical protein
MNKVERVTLAEKRTETGWYLIEAWLDESGDLILSGREPSDMPKAAFGCTEYEYHRRIPAEFKDALLLLLLRERFKSDAMFQQWLERHSIPYEYTSSMTVK